MSEFDQIKAYYGQDYIEARDRLLASNDFLNVLKKVAGENYEMGVEMLRNSTSYKEIHVFIFKLLQENITKRTDGFTCSGTDSIGSNDAHLYITNHRDILMDPAFMQFILDKKNIQGTEIAIGDNLLIYKWIEDLVRINRSFTVKRDVGIREAIIESKRLSSYIRHQVTQTGHSVWLAQTEGRTKDGNDATQTGLLKMVNLSSQGDIIDAYKELEIIPVALSYEYNPCSAYFAYESFMKANESGFKKSPGDDIANMAKGFLGYKGRVHFGFGTPLNTVIDQFRSLKNNKEKILAIKEFIDQEIYKNYALQECNYIAYDMKHKTDKFSSKYKQIDIEKFYSVLEKQKEEYDIDYEFLKEYYINMNSMPLENYLATNK